MSSASFRRPSPEPYDSGDPLADVAAFHLEREFWAPAEERRKALAAGGRHAARLRTGLDAPWNLEAGAQLVGQRHGWTFTIEQESPTSWIVERTGDGHDR